MFGVPSRHLFEDGNMPTDASVPVRHERNRNDRLNVQHEATAIPAGAYILNEDWNRISRTIVPVVSQSDIFPGAGDQLGLGTPCSLAASMKMFHYPGSIPDYSGISGPKGMQNVLAEAVECCPNDVSLPEPL